MFSKILRQLKSLVLLHVSNFKKSIKTFVHQSRNNFKGNLSEKVKTINAGK